jgi:cytoskeletal protein CcmA (bactofilin family)
MATRICRHGNCIGTTRRPPWNVPENAPIPAHFPPRLTIRVARLNKTNYGKGKYRMFKKQGAQMASPRDTATGTTPALTDRLRPRSPTPEKGGPHGRLTVGPDIRLIGASIEDCDTLLVEGRVEASMDSRVIQIAESGTFVGAAAVDEAEVHGRFEGELTVRDRLTIHRTGRISGTVRYGRLSVEEGGEIAGDIAARVSSDTTIRKHRPAPAPAQPPEPTAEPELLARTTGG